MDPIHGGTSVVNTLPNTRNMKDPETNQLLQTLMKCITACEHCADACLDEPDPSHMKECVRLDRDCADICMLTARCIGRDSDRSHDLLRVCIVVCDACREECSRHENAHCRKCAEVCAVCHDACQEYINVHA